MPTLKQIGNILTPWPSWMIAAHPTRAPPEALHAFLDTLTTYARAFDEPAQRTGADIEFIKDKFGYPEEDVKVTSLLSSPALI